MATFIWRDKNPKRIQVKGDSISATLHFMEGYKFVIDDEKACEFLKKKLSDDIKTGRLEVLNSVRKELSKEDKPRTKVKSFNKDLKNLDIMDEEV